MLLRDLRRAPERRGHRSDRAQSIKKTYGKKGDEIVALNFQAVDRALAALERVTVPAAPTTSRRLPNLVPDDAPPFVKRVTAVMMSGKETCCR
ncbi:MAG: hypothetical protein U0166_12085 [Acidobacteriota bacterium]